MTAHLRCDACGRIETEHSAELAYLALRWNSCWPLQVMPSALAIVLFSSQPEGKYALDLCPACDKKAFQLSGQEYGFFGPPPSTHPHASFTLKGMESDSPHRVFAVSRGASSTLKALRWAWILLMVVITFWQVHMFFRWLEGEIVCDPAPLSQQNPSIKSI